MSTIVTKWIRTGKVHDFVFLGKDVIATTSGNYVIFYNLTTKDERIEYFNSTARGEGASCLAGHPIIPVFSTVERRCSPKIYVHTYPEIRKVAECKLGQVDHNSYLSCCFAGTEYLLSLTSFPNFRLIVWFWRTGEKMASIDTMLRDEAQVIEASINSSHLVYQFSPTCGKLLAYEIYAYSKKIKIIRNNIKLIKYQIVCVSWTNNGNLLLCDMFQNVYIVSGDGKKSELIVCGDTNVVVNKPILVLPFYNGFIIVNNNSQLTCYNKLFLNNNVNESWNVTWSVTCKSHPLKMTLARHKEAILLYSEGGKIFELRLHNNKPELEEIFNDCREVKFICSLKPEQTHCALLDDSNCLRVLNIFDGIVSAKFKIKQEDEVLYMATHPSIPLLTISTISGKCIYFIVSIKELIILKTVHLLRQPLHKIKFSKNGTSLGASATNNIFVLETIINKDIKVLIHIKHEKFIVDFLIYERDEILQLLVLFQTISIAYVGDCIEIYSVNKSENSFFKTHKVYMSSYYQNMEYGLENVCDFLGSPYLSKQLHLFKIENNYESIILVNVISSEHKLRKFDVNISKNLTITSGFDGFIILRETLDLSKTLNIFMPHHYQERGIKKSVSSPCGKVIVCLGKNGSLVGLEVCKSKEEIVDEEPIKLKEIEKLIWECTNINEFSHFEDQTWLEQKELRVIQKERDEMLVIKNIILMDLEELKVEIKNLLDLNETKSVECRVPISEFDLNAEKKDEKIKTAACKQEKNKVCMQEQINQKERVIDYLMENFWNTLEIHDCTLLSFNGKTYVNNFTLRRIDKLEKIDDFSIELFNTPLSNSTINLSDNIESEVYFEWPSSFLEESANESINSPFLKYNDNMVFSGSTSFKWVKDDIPPNQLSNISFDSIDYDVIASRENKLKIYFNTRFNEMKRLKNTVLEETTNRLERLRKCKSELKDVFGIILKNDKFTNIKWHSVETPENVISIKEDEISSEFQTNIYLSNDDEVSKDPVNSTKEPLTSTSENKYAFRKGKLEEMMNGILEIRWEDEIRMEIPKPICLLFKHPSKYTKEDIEAIQNYHQKVEKLQFEREKYKIYLQSEILDINDQIKADVEKFDIKMEEFALEKMKIKSAVLQEFLLRLNQRKSQFLNDYGNRKIFFIVNNDISLLEGEYCALTSEVTCAEQIVAELKSKYESLNKRDKLLEGKFRGEFADLKQPMIEHLLRQYKRRPRIGQITCTSLTCLVETNKCLTAAKKSAILPREYLDFLRGMDALDVMPSSLPAQIDAGHWQSLCKLRRNKVEMEIKLRIVALELAEAEQTFFHMQKYCSVIQSKIYFMKNSVEEETLKQLSALRNPDMQLVMKTAQIEVFITGHMGDFENSSVVTYRHLIEVNNQILKEGKNKIAAMHALMVLRKSILFRGWKYQRTLKKLKHFKEYLGVLQKAKIGKEMQNFLVERLEGKFRYKDSTSCEKMLQSVEKKFKRMLSEERKSLRRVIAEIKHWRKMNAELMTRIEGCSLEKQERSSNLEEDHLRKKNSVPRKNQLHSMTKRTSLVEIVKESGNELLNLETELELMKLKTCPKMRLKNVPRSMKSRMKKNR